MDKKLTIASCPNCLSGCVGNDCGICNPGYYLDTTGSNTGDCRLCDNSCLTCSGSGSNKCVTCDPGYYLTGSFACNNCNGACATCFGSTSY